MNPYIVIGVFALAVAAICYLAYCHTQKMSQRELARRRIVWGCSFRPILKRGILTFLLLAVAVPALGQELLTEEPAGCSQNLSCMMVTNNTSMVLTLDKETLQPGYVGWILSETPPVLVAKGVVHNEVNGQVVKNRTKCLVATSIGSVMNTNHAEYSWRYILDFDRVFRCH